MSVADNDAGAKDGEARKTDFADSVFLHTHYADLSEGTAGCASYRRKQAKLRDSGVVAAPRKCTDDAKFKSFQFSFGPARRTRADTCATHGADGTLAHNFAGKGGSALGKISSAGIKNDVAHPRSRRNGLSGDHHHFPAFRNCQQLRDRCTTNLPSTTEDNCGEILIHKEDLYLREGCDSLVHPKREGYLVRVPFLNEVPTVLSRQEPERNIFVLAAEDPSENVVPHACPCGDLYFLFVLAALMSVQQSAATQLNSQPNSETSRSVTINRELILSHQLRVFTKNCEQFDFEEIPSRITS